MIEEHYGKYIRDDGDKLLREYVASATLSEEEESATLGETFSTDGAKYWRNLASPTGFEPVLPA